MNRGFFLSLMSVILALNSMLWAQKELTIADIFASGKFQMKALSGVQWSPDGQSFIFMKYDSTEQVRSFYRHEVGSGSESLWLSGKALKPAGSDKPVSVDSYTISESGKRLLIKSNSARVWRRYSQADFYVFDIPARKLIPVYDGQERIRHAKLSPDEKHVAYVLDNNIYIKDLENGTTRAATSDGSETVINGQFDWVYEEEFGMDDGWRWSPDGRRIAFWRLDQSQVPQFTWVDYDSTYGRVHTIHYPKAGRKNSLVQIGVYDLQSRKTTWMDIGPETDIYIPRIKWTQDPQFLSVQRLDRLQQNLEILLADVRTGQTRPVLTDTDTCWVDVDDDVFFLPDRQGFIFTSERSGFNHIYLSDWQGKSLQQLTSGQWEVGRVYGVDAGNERVYFSANREHTAETHIYSVRLNGKDLKKLSTVAGSHRADFSPDWQYFIHYYSSFEMPLQTDLRRADGTLIRNLVRNTTEKYEEYGVTQPELVSFTTEDGVEIRAMITRPNDFDPARKYPVLIYGYGGPGSQLVRNSWGRGSSRLWYSLLNQKGYIIFTLDNRGTGGRGKAFKNLAYGDIGKYMVIDHVQGAKYLAGLPYVDPERIGIWGWSGGGYLTLMCMTRGSEYFKAGIAVAPVTDYHLYDNIWTERYMGLPQTNAAGYDSASVLTYVKEYKGGLLVVHGMGDDNVHVQNTMQFVTAMQNLNKQFRLMVYPQKNHSILGRNTRLHLYTMMTNYILENL